MGILGSLTVNNIFYTLYKNILYCVTIVRTFVLGSSILGYECIGNANGILAFLSITEKEITYFCESLPDTVLLFINKSASLSVGNIITCNDKLALVHSFLEKNNEEIICDTLGLEVLRITFSSHIMIGSYCILTNKIGFIYPDTSSVEFLELSLIIGLIFFAGSINRF